MGRMASPIAVVGAIVVATVLVSFSFASPERSQRRWHHGAGNRGLGRGASRARSRGTAPRPHGQAVITATQPAGAS